MRRLITLAVTLSAVAAGLFLVPDAALAIGEPTISGAATPTSADSGQTVTFTYTIANTLAYTATTLVAKPDALLSFIAGSVTLDGASQPSVTLSGSTIPVPIPDSAASSSHVVTYLAQPNGTASANSSSNATFSFTDTANPTGTSIDPTAVPVAVNQPDIAVSYPPGSGQDSTLPLTLGGFGFLDILVDNAGAGAPPTTVFIDFPTALTLDGTSIFTLDADVPCTAVTASPGRFGCDIGAVTAGDEIELGVPVTTTTAAVIGQTVSMTVSAQPTDTTIVDANQTNNSQTASIEFAASPRLVPTISASSKKVTVGDATSLTLSVRNDGEGSASVALAAAVLENKHFAITKFDGKELDLTDLSGISSSGGISALSLRHTLASQIRSTTALSSILTQVDAASEDGLDPSQARIWDLGELAPGQSMTAHLTVKAVSVGTARVGLLPLSMPDDPICANDTSDEPGPECFATLSLQAVAVVPKVASTASSPELANSGASTTTPTLLAAGLLLTGGAALRLGRRRG
jgi:hypothetical protein